MLLIQNKIIIFFNNDMCLYKLQKVTVGIHSKNYVKISKDLMLTTVDFSQEVFKFSDWRNTGVKEIILMINYLRRKIEKRKKARNYEFNVVQMTK